MAELEYHSEDFETDKVAGKIARLFVDGLSECKIIFLKPGEKAP